MLSTAAAGDRGYLRGTGPVAAPSPGRHAARAGEVGASISSGFGFAHGAQMQVPLPVTLQPIDATSRTLAVMADAPHSVQVHSIERSARGVPCSAPVVNA